MYTVLRKTCLARLKVWSLDLSVQNHVGARKIACSPAPAQVSGIRIRQDMEFRSSG